MENKQKLRKKFRKNQ